MSHARYGRHSIYLRKGKDRDLISYINGLLPDHDFAEIVRDLMRDGIKYRKQKVETDSYNKPTNSINPPITNSFSPDIKLAKMEVSEDDLKGRLDDF